MKATTHGARTHPRAFPADPQKRESQYEAWQTLKLILMRCNALFGLRWRRDEPRRWNHARACLEHAAKLGIKWLLSVCDRDWNARKYAEQVWRETYEIPSGEPTPALSDDYVRRIYLTALVDFKLGAWKAMMADLRMILELTKDLDNIILEPWNGSEGPFWPYRPWAIRPTRRRRLAAWLVDRYIRWKSPHPVIEGTVRHLYAPVPPEPWRFDTRTRLTRHRKEHITEAGATREGRTGALLPLKVHAQMFRDTLARAEHAETVILNRPLEWDGPCDGILLEPLCMDAWREFVGLNVKEEHE